jgi:hypothetical protein
MPFPWSNLDLNRSFRFSVKIRYLRWNREAIDVVVRSQYLPRCDHQINSHIRGFPGGSTKKLQISIHMAQDRPRLGKYRARVCVLF